MRKKATLNILLEWLFALCVIGNKVQFLYDRFHHSNCRLWIIRLLSKWSLRIRRNSLYLTLNIPPFKLIIFNKLCVNVVSCNHIPCLNCCYIHKCLRKECHCFCFHIRTHSKKEARIGLETTVCHHRCYKNI